MRPTEKIESALKKMSFTTSAELREQILDEALEAFARKETQPAFKKLNVWRTIMKSKITKLAAAAAIIAIAGIVSVQLVTGTRAYAQVVAEIKKARTVVFTQITQDNQGDGETIKTDIAFKEPGLIRTTTVDGYIAVADFTSGKMISIVPQGGYSVGDLNSPNKSSQMGPLDSIEAMKNLPEKADEKLGEKEIDGIDCDGYKVTQGDLTTTVWINTETGDLVQVEQKYASTPGMNKIIKNIKFDVELNDSLFSMTPPTGFKQFGTELKSDSSAETEETFITFLRWWAGATVDETFPPIVVGSEMAKVVMDMGQQGKLKGELWKNVDTQQMFNAMLFVSKLPKESNWRYAGNGVKINTPDTPIFWYKPAGSENYRVIYADLTVKELSADQLPK